MMNKFDNTYIEKEYKLNFKRETPHFIIHYTEFDNKSIDKVSEVLEDSYSRITTIFKIQLNEKLVIEIHPDHKQLHSALGLSNAPNWIRGGVGLNNIAI